MLGIMAILQLLLHDRMGFCVVATISANVHKTTLGWKNEQEHNKLHGWHYVLESRAIVTRKTIRMQMFPSKQDNLTHFCDFDPESLPRNTCISA